MDDGTDVALKLERIEQMLDESLELAEENNKLLRSIQRGNLLAFWSKVLLWTVIIILPFIFIGPIMTFLAPITGAAAGKGNVLGTPTAAQLEKAYNAFKASQQTPAAAQ